MYIEKITIRNFRIYYGVNSIRLESDANRNINIICGDNGHGKTTLLTALVWCLYGKQMQDVDKFYRDRVIAAGGYHRYLLSCMNKLALSEGADGFSVGVELRNIELAGVQCNSMQINRECRIANDADTLQIKLDGSSSELVNEMGQQVFIQDFVMPKEIAKFFFFDAERIVTMAEIQSVNDKRLLGKAYSEVLGIKKYEDLRNNLNDLRIRFRRESATDAERREFEELGREIGSISKSINQHEKRKEKLLNNKTELKTESERVQEKLLREGNYLSISEFRELQSERTRLHENGRVSKNELRDLFELAPFAITGKLLTLVNAQLEREEKKQKSTLLRKVLEDRISRIIRALGCDLEDAPSVVDTDVKDYYVSKVQNLLTKYLVEENGDSYDDDVKVLHDFTREQEDRFDEMLSMLRSSYKERLQTLHRSMKMNSADYSNISNKLRYAESREGDPLTKSYREEKEKVDIRLRNIDDEIIELSTKIGALESNLMSKRESYEQSSAKIEVDEQFEAKDKLVTRLSSELSTFIRRIKLEKKVSLEQRILANLHAMMHKKEFIQRVIVEVESDILDIHLVDSRGAEVDKDNLSRGEQQLYATAILKALVEESGVSFPVFVDSPLQKFDDKHSRNIIAGFYPRISKQVIILPLLNKELSADEYRLMADHVGAAFIIDNLSEDASRLRQVDPAELFVERSLALT